MLHNMIFFYSHFLITFLIDKKKAFAKTWRKTFIKKMCLKIIAVSNYPAQRTKFALNLKTFEYFLNDRSNLFNLSSCPAWIWRLNWEFHREDCSAIFCLIFSLMIWFMLVFMVSCKCMRHWDLVFIYERRSWASGSLAWPELSGGEHKEDWIYDIWQQKVTAKGWS
jgi:hypothetical protein